MLEKTLCLTKNIRFPVFIKKEINVGDFRDWYKNFFTWDQGILPRLQPLKLLEKIGEYCPLNLLKTRIQGRL